MKPVRIGLIGIMRAVPLKYLLGTPELYKLTALCDIDPACFGFPEAT